jgi:hypothetical protein
MCTIRSAWSESKIPSNYANATGSDLTILTVSTLTRTTCPTSRTMYCSSFARVGSDRDPAALVRHSGDQARQIVARGEAVADEQDFER